VPRSPLSRLLTPRAKTDAFDTEAPTGRIPRTKPQRAADLVRDWNECPPDYQRMLERLAKKGSKLPKKKAP
jgi:hypothetical protein